MSLLLITFLLLAGASLQTLLPALPGLAEWPVLTALILCISLRCVRSRVLYASLLAGVLNDAFCPAPLGVSLPFFVLLALGVYAIHEEVFGDQIITYAVLGLLAGLSHVLYFTFVFAATGLRPLGVGLLTARLFGGLLLGALTTPLIFLLIGALQSKRIRKTRWIEE